MFTSKCKQSKARKIVPGIFHNHSKHSNQKKNNYHLIRSTLRNKIFKFLLHEKQQQVERYTNNKVGKNMYNLRIVLLSQKFEKFKKKLFFHKHEKVISISGTILLHNIRVLKS